MTDFEKLRQHIEHACLIETQPPSHSAQQMYDRLTADGSDLTMRVRGDLAILNYGKGCQLKKPAEWTFLERNCRGLIVDWVRGEIVALPFAKFWNMGEVPQSELLIETLTEKMDGSLGITYRERPGGTLKIATRGSFDSAQANWATQMLHERRPDLDARLPHNTTLLFEILYPPDGAVQQTVIQYDIDSMYLPLVLIGARNTYSGADLSYKELAALADVYELQVVKQLHNFGLETLEQQLVYIAEMQQKRIDTEGWVARLADGTRLKFKTAWYAQAHRLVGDLSYRNLAKLMLMGNADDMLATVPAWTQDVCRERMQEIVARADETQRAVWSAYDDCINWAATFDTHDEREIRKHFAIHASQKYRSISKYLFGLYDDVAPSRSVRDSLLARKIIEDIFVKGHEHDIISLETDG